MRGKHKLTDAALRSAKSAEKPYKLFDGHGLYILVNPDGSKYWRFKYRFEGRENQISFGVYPEVSLQLARERLREARRLVAAGTDPSEARKAEVSLRRNTKEQRKDVRSIALADVVEQTLQRVAGERPPEAAGSAFEQWFIHQHGKRPSRFGQTDAELRTEVRVGEEAGRELRERQEWDQRWTSALWAWQARK